MFIENKYTQTYYNIIDNASKREGTDGYTETHHIIPRSLGGTDDANNLVCLTPREHYLCHALLPKMVDNTLSMHKMYAAFNMMHVDSYGNRYTSRLYEYYKVKFYDLHKKKMTGRKRSLESRRKQSETTRGKPWTKKARETIRSKPTAKPVIAYKKDTGEFVGEWESCSLAGKALNTDVTAVWLICEGTPLKRGGKKGKMYPMRSSNGFIFKYKDQP